jgi:hypothetical protein
VVDSGGKVLSPCPKMGTWTSCGRQRDGNKRFQWGTQHVFILWTGLLRLSDPNLRSILRRFLDMTDDQDLSESLGGLELESELLLNRGIQVWQWVSAISWRRDLGSHALEL